MQLNVMIRNCVFILFIRYVSLLHLLLEKKIKYKLKKREAGRGLAASFLFHPSFFSFLSFSCIKIFSPVLVVTCTYTLGNRHSLSENEI